MKTPNTCELLVQVAREAEKRAILALANECETLEELKRKIEASLPK